MARRLKQLIQGFRHVALTLVVAIGFLSIIASGGGTDGEPPPSQNTGAGWIRIEQPTSEPTYVVEAEKISLSGEAFISPTFFVCCTGSAGDTGVKVSWVNQTTGIHGRASQTADYCGFSPCGHHWSAQVPLTLGTNQITVTASDDGGNIGRKTIVVTRIDVTAPTVTLTSPAPDETEVALNTLIEVAFSEGLDSTTVNSSTFLLRDDANTPVDGTVTYHDVAGCLVCGKLATFTPSSSLSASTTYTATLTSGIQDLAGHTMLTDHVWTFTTGSTSPPPEPPEPDTTPPSVTSVNPENNATCVATDGAISAEFSEEIDAATVNDSSFVVTDNMGTAITGVITASNTSTAFQPNLGLAYATSYTATITSAVTDLAGNALASDYTWGFTTQQSLVGTWSPVATGDAPVSRSGHTAVWTGSEMIVWGGFGIAGDLGTGGRYDPAKDEWVPTATAGAPVARSQHTAVWTGSEMIVWGGIDETAVLDTGGRYDPITDTWRPVSTSGVPVARRRHTAVWTGSEMIVWGGEDQDGRGLNTGARYDPITDTWQPVSTTGAPSARYGATAVWTGNEMIVWGGAGGDDTGGRYDPATDTWRPMSTIGAPGPFRFGHSAVWTGSEMIIWGGRERIRVQTGAAYHPASDSWRPVSSTCSPSARESHTAVWTGTQMIIWGGYDGSGLNSGAAYDPLNGIWQATQFLGAPSGRRDHTAIWTGTQMIIWGGGGTLSANSGTGGLYSP